MADKDRLRKLVERINSTSNADFVKRLLDKKRAVLNNVDGTVSTHELAYVDVGDGNAVVYPEVQSSMCGLMRYPSANAYDRAVERGDTLHMSVPDAELFTTGYKDYYPGFDMYACGGKKYPGGGKFFRTNLRNEAPLMYEPMVNINYPVVSPMRFRPQPDLGDYRAPASTGMVVDYPIALPERVPVSVQDSVSAPVVVEAPVENLFSDEMIARRALKQRYAESAFNDKAKSKAGAQGAWQIMPITLKDYLGRGRGKAGDLNDPVYNRKVRDWVMGIIPRDLQEFWSEDDSDRAKLAKLYAAYNWGAGNLRGFLRKKQKAGVDISNPDNWVDDLNPETRRYVKYLAFDEDIPDSTVYTNAAFEKAAADRGFADGGSIHIAPSKRGTFTAAAKKHGKSVQAFASQVLAHKENYSPAMIKKANFARNSKKWKHADGGFLKNYFEQGGPERQNWFTRATLGAMMAESPAVATASGWTRDPQGNVEQNSQNDPGVEKLRNSLSVIAGTSFAAPLLASAPGMAVNWLSNPANQMVAGKFMTPLLGAGAFDSAMKKYTPYTSWGNALGNTLGVYDNPLYQYGLGDFGKGLVNNAMEFTNPAFFAPYDNLSKNISGLYDRGMGYLRNIRRPTAKVPEVSDVPVTLASAPNGSTPSRQIQEYWNNVDDGTLQMVLDQLGDRGMDNSALALAAMKSSKDYSIDKLYEMLRNYDSLVGNERALIDSYINASYGRPSYHVPTDLAAQQRNKAIEERFRSMLPEHLRDRFTLESLYDPYADGYVETAQALRDAGFKLPADIDHLSWFQVDDALKNGTSIHDARRDVGIQTNLIQRAMPRQSAIYESDRSPQSLLLSYRSAVRSPKGYGTGPGQTSIVQMPEQGLEMGNNYQTRRIRFDSDGNMTIGEPTVGAEENFFTKSEFDSFLDALEGNGGDLRSTLESNPEFIGLSDKLIRLSRAMNQADWKPIDVTTRNINRNYGAELTSPPLDIYANTSDTPGFWSSDNLSRLHNLWYSFETSMAPGASPHSQSYAVPLHRVPSITLKHKYGGLIDRHSPESLRKAIENIRGKKK